MLFNGFQPLFQALNPQQVNELSMNIVQVLQGEGGTIEGLLAKTASLTNTLADRDQLIGQVITNLGQTLDTVDQHHQQLTRLVVELKGWMADLARDRKTIGSSLHNISEPDRGGRRPREGQPADAEVRRRRSCAGWPRCSTSRRTARWSSTCSTGYRSR